MTTEQYRNNLNNWIDNYRLAESLNNFDKFVNFRFLTACLSNPNFHKEASVEDLYNFRAEIFKLSAKAHFLSKTIDEREFLFGEQFEDQKMSFEDLGIKTRIFECIKAFQDDLNMNVLPGTIFEVEELLYPNSGNLITGFYRNLVTDKKSGEIKDYFENGGNVMINLKILEEYFRPLHQ